MNIQLGKSDLQAALTCAAVKDIREYLCGVYLEFVPTPDGGIVTFVGTNGHLLFASTAPAVFNEGEQNAPFWITIPRDTVKAACKGKQPRISLVRLPDGRYTLGDTVFSAIDGKFPDFRKIIPDKVSGEMAQFNPDQVAQGNKALQLYYGRDRMIFRLNHGGNRPGVISDNGRDACVVIMPIRVEGMEYSGMDLPAMPETRHPCQ